MLFSLNLPPTTESHPALSRKGRVSGFTKVNFKEKAVSGLTMKVPSLSGLGLNPVSSS